MPKLHVLTSVLCKTISFPEVLFVYNLITLIGAGSLISTLC